MASVIVAEELARIDASHSITVGAPIRRCAVRPSTGGAPMPRRRGTSLPLASGQVIGGFGLTEPRFGFGREWHAHYRGQAGRSTTSLNGQKTWITHGGVGEVFVVAVPLPRQGRATRASAPSS